MTEQRHGHPVKLRGEVLTFVLDYCQHYASAASREVQRLVTGRFGITVSISWPHEDHPDTLLCLQVAPIRDLRRTVPIQPDPEEAEVRSRWDSDLPLEERTW